jgi:hypothetical protein
MLIVISSYGSSQRLDHEKYDALNDATKPLTDDIPMADRGDPWEYRASAEEENRGHMRHESTASTVMNAPLQKEHYVDGSSYLPPTYPPQHQSQSERRQSTRTAVSHPSNAFNQGSEPAPYANNYYGSGGPVEEPAQTQAHPGGY